MRFHKIYFVFNFFSASLLYKCIFMVFVLKPLHAFSFDHYSAVDSIKQHHK